MIERKYSDDLANIKAKLLVGVKQHLRITSGDFDSHLDLLIDAAIEQAEKESGCIFLPSEFTIKEQSIIDFGGFYPVFEATSLKIDGNVQDISLVKLSGGRVYVEAEASDIEVVFDAGYKLMPKTIEVAIYMIVGKWFINPNDSVEQLPKASTNLLRNFRRWLN